MIKEVWLNLPVKDVNVSKKFFSAIGFSFNDKNPDPNSAALVVGSKGTIVMLFPETMFKNFTQNNVADTKQGNEILISFDAESKQEVDDLADKVSKAGGNVFAKPTEIQGWMYGCGFADPDGHRWNILFMDKSKMPKN